MMLFICAIGAARIHVISVVVQFSAAANSAKEEGPVVLVVSLIGSTPPLAKIAARNSGAFVAFADIKTSISVVDVTALSPKIVTFFGSPLNFEMLSWTHCNAIF